MSKRAGTIIAELRKEAGYTQKSLAAALHITDKAVSKWERGICLPDSSLLPKLSLLLDADIDFLLSHKGVDGNDWIGLVDLRNYDVDLSQVVYDKPMVYYMLSHFLLLGIKELCFFTSKRNRAYLENHEFQKLGFSFSFDFSGIPQCNIMILNSPCFLFGSDLTRQFQGAMVSKSLIKLVPCNQKASFLFCPAEKVHLYLSNPVHVYESATERTLGRGMVNVIMENSDDVLNVSNFVCFYQKSTGLLISGLEEIACHRDVI